MCGFRANSRCVVSSHTSADPRATQRPHPPSSRWTRAAPFTPAQAYGCYVSARCHGDRISNQITSLPRLAASPHLDRWRCYETGGCWRLAASWIVAAGAHQWVWDQLVACQSLCEGARAHGKRRLGAEERSCACTAYGDRVASTLGFATDRAL